MLPVGTQGTASQPGRAAAGARRRTWQAAFDFARDLVDRDDLERELGPTDHRPARGAGPALLSRTPARRGGGHPRCPHRHRQVPVAPGSGSAAWLDAAGAHRRTDRGAPGMNTDPRLEQRVADALNRAASTREPDGLLDSVLSTVGRTRARPRWLALIKEPPMASPCAGRGRFAGGATRLPRDTHPVDDHPRHGRGRGGSLAAADAGHRGRPGWFGYVPDDHRSGCRGAGRRHRAGETGDLPRERRHHRGHHPPGGWRSGGGDHGVRRPMPSGRTHRRSTTGPSPTASLLDDSDAHVENITLRGRSGWPHGEIPAAVVIDGGAPVVEQLDMRPRR